MKSVLQVVAGLTLAGSAAVILGHCDVDWRTLSAPQTWDLFGNYSYAQEQQHRKERLTAEQAATSCRIASNDRISREVLEGRQTLRRAAAEFQQVNGDFEGMWIEYASEHPGWSQEKLGAVGVIKGVQAILLDGGQDGAETVAVLWAEVEHWDAAE